MKILVVVKELLITTFKLELKKMDLVFIKKMLRCQPTSDDNAIEESVKLKDQERLKKLLLLQLGMKKLKKLFVKL